MKELTVDSVGISVRTSYDPTLVQALKSVDGRARWDREAKAWRYPAEPMVAGRLCSLLGLSTDVLPESLRQPRVSSPLIDEADVDAARAVWSSIGRSTPYQHQLHGLALLNRYDAFALFWEMGCGKSAPICVRLAQYRQAKPTGRVLIVCPKNALHVWPEELARHTGLSSRDVVILNGTSKQRSKVYRQCPPIVVTNFETVRQDLSSLLRLGFDMVVIDEAHRIKTINAVTSKAVRKLSCDATYRYALTGTPAPNSPIDVCGILAYLDDEILGTESITAIKRMYCIEGGFSGYQIVGYRDLDDLERRTATVSHRVTKNDCLDLPPKIFETRHVEMSAEQRRIYRQIKDDAVAVIDQHRQAGLLTVQNVLTESLRLLQVLGGFVPDNDHRVHAIEPNPKLAALLDLVDDLGNEQVIVWCSFVAEVVAVATALEGVGGVSVHYGETSQADRVKALDRFRNGETRFLVATPQSAREAITLVNCATMVYYSRGYNLLDWLQSQDRSHRIGQTRPVTIVSLVCPGTIDDRVAQMLDEKITLQDLISKGGELF